MRLIKDRPLDYYQLTLDALQWVSYDLYLDKVEDALRENIKAKNPDFWNLHVALCYLSRTLNPQSYLEIGTRKGRSLFQVLCHAPVARVVSIDLFTESNFLDLKADVDRFLRRTKKKIAITYYRERSVSSLEKIKGKEKFDLITIDGSHYLEDAANDLASSYSLLNDQGVIVVDDVTQMPHLMQMVNEFQMKHNEFQLVRTDQLYGCAVLSRGRTL
ncbi:MAG: hypothetical protein A3G33_04955 [Omnitrophica bacterium RIFCSPLOWO2_12_FULL_44_17]|uniref:Methyltransferase domain-containing protein n=1 Tax=Candidatus Danuiimicrobium aquiferis TaxID=1801832 RepID=A0A1G1KXU1_9BACT|nr:MAG: hypothetical protein A3B72_02380 [Omnitrophica bacterium RIFCSPHIGHO2_02_FULL_45_28]OGW89189.1 MAG: hypothetical protein A3E74_07895 [Omnitrophica bacterium RIFCSPHIGHO2_12_FULL_44_12]OGW97642.1 MAG: hypothetical protein A3G33_04955 [Omnitrophica bacterium RIFCSPLOWO2_12_FULL_44_17]OGX04638.1 MAG: hypothetical protein A3J12_09195 [Omnitrophica bacterium RIFCSPLOWO2_02_FULL_44_11]